MKRVLAFAAVIGAGLAFGGGIRPSGPGGDGLFISVNAGPGGVATDGGVSGYVKAAGGTNPRTLADRATDVGVSILDFGDAGTCDGTANHDAFAAFKAAEAYLGAAGGGTLLIPNSMCYSNLTLRVKHSNITVQGLGPKSQLAAGPAGAPALIISGVESAIPYAGPSRVDPTCFAISMGQDDVIVMDDASKVGSLDGLTGFTAKGWYTPPQASATGGFVGSYGRGLTTTEQTTPTDPLYGAFTAYVANGNMGGVITLTDGGVCVATDPGVMASGHTYYWEEGFDGSRLRLYKGDMDAGMSVSVVADVACAGAMSQKPWESTSVGPIYRSPFQTSLVSYSAPGVLDSPQIRDVADHSDAGFTLSPASWGPFDSHILLLVNACPVYGSVDPGDDMLVPVWAVANAAVTYYRGAYPSSLTNVRISNLKVSPRTGQSMGILALGCQNCWFDHLLLSGTTYEGLTLRNNSYDSRISDSYIVGANPYNAHRRPRLRLQGASGLTSIRDVVLQGDLGLYSHNSATMLSNIYAVSNLLNFWFTGPAVIHASGLAGSYENVYQVPVANLVADGVTGLNINGSVFENSSLGTAPALIFDSTFTRGFPIHIDTSTMNAPVGASPAFAAFRGPWDAGWALFTQVVRADQDGGTPLCAGDAGVCVDDWQGVRTFRP